MARCRILVVEDDPMISLHLESIITQAVDAEVVVAQSIGEARGALPLALGFALLDVDVLDGTTYGFAAVLAEHRVPFAFLSASNREQVPDPLRDVPFLAKPYAAEDVVALLRAATAR